MLLQCSERDYLSIVQSIQTVIPTSRQQSLNVTFPKQKAINLSSSSVPAASESTACAASSSLAVKQ